MSLKFREDRNVGIEQIKIGRTYVSDLQSLVFVMAHLWWATSRKT